MFQKRICTKIISLLLVIGCLMSEPVLAEKQKEPEAQTLYSKSCAMVDGDSGRLLYGKEAQTALPNASTTKILTCIVAMEQCKPDEVVTFSAKAASQPKVHLGAKKGEQFYMQDLWYGLMLESYNDCAYAIAEHVAGSAEKFAALMNEKAKKIGCTDSHFVTPNGLDAKDEQGEHHTTAYDLCRIMSYCAWKSPVSKQFLEVTQTRSHTFQSLEGTGYDVSNKNALLDMMDHVITGKTGYTSKAGYCYVAALEEGGRHYAIALLACGWPNHKNYKWSDAKTLFQYGMDAYHLYRGSEASMELPDIEIAQGCRKETLEEWATHAKLPVYVDTDITKLTFLKKNGDTAEIKKVLSDPISLPVKKGQTLGRVSYCMNGREIYSGKIKAEVSVKKWSLEKFFQIMWKEALLGK
jgi:D-alanyl-D-alanine carboxypeptidase (penicillin-binding protein 5/6)